MTRLRSSYLVFNLLVGAFLLNGCVTFKTPVVGIATPVQPAPGERVVVDKAIIVVDASGSMYLPDRYRYEKQLARSFVNAMPEGAYDAGFVCFGGEYKGAWVWESPRPFDREALHLAVDRMYWISGSTPLDEALKGTGESIAGESGNAAIIVFSDGEALPNPVMDATRGILNDFHGRVCIYTVHFGDNKDGATLLSSISALTQCGVSVTPDSIETEEGMKNFVRMIFFGAQGANMRVETNVTTIEQRGGAVTIVRFDSGKSYLKADYAYVIDETVAKLKASPNKRIQIVGYIDSGEAANSGLAVRRANAVRDALLERGIDGPRILVVESPAGNAGSAAHSGASMRRVELTLVE